MKPWHGHRKGPAPRERDGEREITQRQRAKTGQGRYFEAKAGTVLKTEKLFEKSIARAAGRRSPPRPGSAVLQHSAQTPRTLSDQSRPRRVKKKFLA